MCRKINFKFCPRCGEQGFERLPSYAHCVNCNYVEDYQARHRPEVLVLI